MPKVPETYLEEVESGTISRGKACLTDFQSMPLFERVPEVQIETYKYIALRRSSPAQSAVARRA